MNRFDTGKRLSIVVPYRDRPVHLQQFVVHMSAYFSRDKVDKDIDYRVTVVEQANKGQFNAGLLKNIGYLLTRDDADYFCFHDIDYLPVWADYSYPNQPTCILWYGAERRPIGHNSDMVLIHDYKDLFGGVVLFPGQQFARVNGYSTDYWGWGSEDVDLRDRCLAEGIRIGRRDGTYSPLPHDNRGYTADGVMNENAQANRHKRLDRLARLQSEPVYRKEGLNTAEYTVVGRTNIKHPATGQFLENYELVKVDFPVPE